MPPLADGFSARPETAPDLGTTLVPGATVVLALGQTAADKPPDWRQACGKTQIAVYFAESLWRSRAVDLLVWVVAASRASVLSGYAEAAAAIGADDGSKAESVASNLIGWLSQTTRPWLVVLDDLRDAADVEDLWPEGPAGQGPDHDRKFRGGLGRAQGAGAAGAGIQHARGVELLDGPSHRRP